MHGHAPTRSADVAAALEVHRRRRWRFPRWLRARRAAVAAILRDGADGPEVLLIRRAERSGDPWSGDIAFPGGRIDPDDGDALDGAIRETAEEIGVILTRSDLAARLSDLLAVSHGSPRPMAITPFVFLRHDPGPLALNHEVERAVWVPLAIFADPARRETRRWTVGPVKLSVPCVRYDADVVWGLTLRMLDELTAVAWRRPPRSVWTRWRGR